MQQQLWRFGVVYNKYSLLRILKLSFPIPLVLYITLLLSTANDPLGGSVKKEEGPMSTRYGSCGSEALLYLQ